MIRDQMDQLIPAFQAELEAAVEATQAQALMNAEFDSGSLSELIWNSACLADYDNAFYLGNCRGYSLFRSQIGFPLCFQPALKPQPLLRNYILCRRR